MGCDVGDADGDVVVGTDVDGATVGWPSSTVGD